MLFWVECFQREEGKVLRVPADWRFGTSSKESKNNYITYYMGAWRWELIELGFSVAFRVKLRV